MKKQQRYEVRRGFRAPTPSDPSTPDTATYEVWRRQGYFLPQKLMGTFNHRELAEASCNVLNQ